MAAKCKEKLVIFVHWPGCPCFTYLVNALDIFSQNRTKQEEKSFNWQDFFNLPEYCN